MASPIYSAPAKGGQNQTHWHKIQSKQKEDISFSECRHSGWSHYL